MPLYRRPGSPFWWVRIGRSYRRSTGTTDRKRAEQVEQAAQERLWRAAKLGDRGAVSWREVTERWLKDSARPRERDREFLEWLSFLNEEAVSSVADPDALEALRERAGAAGWAPSTIDRMMTTVRAVLRSCVRWRYLEGAPYVPMYRPEAPEPRWLTRSEFTRLESKLPRHLALAARFAVLTGLRHDSMLSLRWDRVDLKARTAWVPGASMKAKKALGIPLSSCAVDVLKKLRRLNPNGAHVFQWRGKPLRNCNTRAFREAVQAANVAPLRWHDLRHTFASWAVQSGVTLPELMALGDWRSYSMVLRYAHLAPSHAADAAEKLAKGSTPQKRSASTRKPKVSGETMG